jgi:hypothetical protein
MGKRMQSQKDMLITMSVFSKLTLGFLLFGKVKPTT